MTFTQQIQNVDDKGNAITNCYGVEFKRDSAGLANGLLDEQGDLIKMDVARHYFAETVGDADERFVDVGVAEAAGVKQAAMRRSLKTFFYCVTSHNCGFSKKWTKD
jgi:hypothetical protein